MPANPQKELPRTLIPQSPGQFRYKPKATNRKQIYNKDKEAGIMQGTK